MAKCPNCGSEIDYLNMYCREENKYKFCLGQTGDAQRLFQTNLGGDDEDDDFECPLCSVCLTDDWDVALTILKGTFGQPEEPDDPPIPCVKCGRIDLPLHENYQCAECWPPHDHAVEGEKGTVQAIAQGEGNANTLSKP